MDAWNSSVTCTFIVWLQVQCVAHEVTSHSLAELGGGEGAELPQIDLKEEFLVIAPETEDTPAKWVNKGRSFTMIEKTRVQGFKPDTAIQKC